ncbi:Polycomb group RING finger protein 2 [Amphibalanus amphitrite]|uniref:Polycomb group RING finger protein 2 n=1 Tax=Amphibalanus amphitrite TaxID=1232801 RepID=A0A6A4W2C6_AMPAM|nr:Polycomb group RING finger protein 2 [Amphibalanus amphitrite]
MSLAAPAGRGRVPMLEVNPHVMCVLCGGYFIDATTIIECLHSFCRKCIVTYLESSRYCPICDVQVHKTKPLLSIRPDATLQDIVYKLVPGLYRDEMRRRREFYASRPASELPGERGEARGEERRAVFAPDELLVVRLQYQYSGGPPCPGQVRYLRCPAQVTVAHLQHMIGCKHELPAGRRVELLARGEVLTSDLMLLDVAYLHSWRRVGPLQLQYRIVAVPVKRALPDGHSEPAKVAASAPAAAERVCRDPARLTNGQEAPPPAIIPAAVPAASRAPTARTQPASDARETPVSTVTSEAVTPAVTAVTAQSEVPPPGPRPKRTESGECKEVQLHISETGEMTFGNGPAAGGGGGTVDILQQACSILVSLEEGDAELPPTKTSSASPAGGEPPPLTLPTTTAPPPAGKGPIRDSNKNEIGTEPRPPRPPDDTGQKRPSKESTPSRPKPKLDDRKRSSPVGYKTLKTPPKSWNPQLPRSYVGTGQKASDPGRTVSPIAPKPPRFFKMRHSSGTSGGPPAEAARAPLLMRVEPSGLPPAIWGDQLLPAGPLSLYPHLYAAQPLSFLPGPTVSMFAPPPAHSGVSQLTYTSAPGSFPLLTAPRPPTHRHLTAPVKSTSANGVQKVALSAAAVGSTPPPTAAVSSSGAPASISASAAERPHIACSVPSSRPRPGERPPSAAPSSLVSASAAAAAGRLPLSAFLQQNTVTAPTALLGPPYSVGGGSRPIANGQAPPSARDKAAPLPLPPPPPSALPPPPPAGVMRSDASTGGTSGSAVKTSDRQPKPPPPPSPRSAPPPPGAGGGKAAQVSSAPARSTPPAGLPLKVAGEARPPPASAAAAAPARPEKTAVTQS